MAIYDYLPTYDYIEPNNLKGLLPGFVVAQMPVATSAKAALTVNGEGKFMANGTICAISEDGIVVPKGDEAALFICYNDPLKTLFDAEKFYAVNLEEEHARLVQLIPGDEWMSTMEPDDVEIDGRIVEVTKTTGLGKSDNWFEMDHMANGDKAYHYVFLG